MDTIIENKQKLDKKDTMQSVDENTSNRIRYMNFIIISFAKGAKMWIPEAYKYLRDFGGLDFLYRHYEYEHTLPASKTHFTLLKVCRNNGGWL